MSEKPKDNPPDLLDAVDSLLDDIDETTQAFTPKDEEAVDPNALISDDGSEANTDSEPDTNAEPQIDSIENAQQALDALDEVEAQAAELTAQSVDALLNTEEVQEPVQVPVDDFPTADQALEDNTESSDAQDEEDLLSSIDDLLDSDPSEVDTIESIESAVDELLEESSQTEDDTEPEDELPTPVDEPAEDVASEPDAVLPDLESIAEVDSEAAPSAEEDASPEVEADELDDVLDTQGLILESLDSSAELDDDSIDLLDSALAEAADDMLDGDFEDEDGELVAGDAVATPTEEALEAEFTESDSEPDQTEDAAPVAETPQFNALDDSDLADAVASLTDLEPAPESDTETEAAESPPETTPSSAPDSAPVSKPTEAPGANIDDLLKDVGEDLLEESVAPQQSPATPAAQPAAQTPPAEAAPSVESPAPETTPQHAASAINDPEVLSEIDALDAVEDQTLSPPAWFVRAVEVCRPKLERIDPFKGKTIDAVATALGQILILVMKHGTPLGARAMIIVSKPLSKQSPEIRNAVGFIALWTAFLGVVLWMYLLMFRTPNIPQPETAPTRVINVDESSIIQPVIQQLP